MKLTQIIKTEYSRGEYSAEKHGEHCNNPWTSTVSNLLCNPLLQHSAPPHFKQSASTWQRCQQSHLLSRNDGPGA